MLMLWSAMRKLMYSFPYVNIFVWIYAMYVDGDVAGFFQSINHEFYCKPSSKYISMH